MSHQNRTIGVDVDKSACLIEELGGKADACKHLDPMSTALMNAACPEVDPFMMHHGM